MNYKIEEVEVGFFNWVSEQGERSQDFTSWKECKEDAQRNLEMRFVD